MPTCPPRHAAHASEMLADNAAALHRIAFPNCPGYNAWPCGDHWHTGHTSYVNGQACKTDPVHEATKRRLFRLGLIHGPSNRG